MEKYLNDEDISSEEIKNAIRKGCLDNTFVPTFCGSAFKNKGVQRLLDAIVDFLPSPKDISSISGVDPKDSDGVLVREPSNDEPFSALAFKIMTDPYVGKVNIHESLFRQFKCRFIRLQPILRQERKNKSHSFNAFQQKRERDAVSTGEIVAAVGLKLLKPDTLCAMKKIKLF